jgi:hypothetical protein
VTGVQTCALPICLIDDVGAHRSPRPLGVGGPFGIAILRRTGDTVSVSLDTSQST